jgi:alanine racemase
VNAAASIRRTRVEIDLAALRGNAEAIMRITGGGMYAVVKADAYGHGGAEVSRQLVDVPGVIGLAVALVEEGLELRAAGISAPVLVMGAAIEGAHQRMVDNDLTPLVSRAIDLERLAEIGNRRRRPVDVHLKFETGMARLGLSSDDIAGCASAAGSGVVFSSSCSRCCAWAITCFGTPASAATCRP